jgi:CO/xanthine dehydrogenase FAD-binding subunit
VIVCLSDASEATPLAPLEVRTGLVQAALVERAAAQVAEHGGELFVAGPSSLMDELRTRADELRHRVHVNA